MTEFHRFGALWRVNSSKKKVINSERYGPLPYASEQGILCCLAGNLNRAIREISGLIRDPALVRYFGPTNPIARTGVRRRPAIRRLSNRSQLTIDALEAKVAEKRGELENLRRQEFRNQDRTLAISADITGLHKRIARASKDADLPTLATLQALSGELTDIKAEAISHIATTEPRIDVEQVQQEARDELLKELIMLFESELPPTCAVAVRNLMRAEYGRGYE